MLTGFTGGKILWMKEEEPENFARTKVILNPKDYVRYKLTGVVATEVSDASGTGLFDVKNRCFSDELIAKLGLARSLFPKCYESYEIVGQVTSEAAKLTGLPAGLPVTAGGGDAVIQTMGSGLVHQGVLGVVIGTSGVVAMGLDGYKENANGELQLFCSNAKHLWHAIGVTLAAGGSYRWYRDALCAADAENADLYRANCEDYCAQLEALDADLRALRASAVRDLLIFADRFPFLYFCEEYDLHYRAAFHGCSGDTEPSLATLKYLIDKVNDEHIPVVYTIDLSSQKVAEAVSECTGARIGRLWSMQTVSRTDFDAGETYLTLMQRNYEALKGGLL